MDAATLVPAGTLIAVGTSGRPPSSPTKVFDAVAVPPGPVAVTVNVCVRELMSDAGIGTVAPSRVQSNG